MPSPTPALAVDRFTSILSRLAVPYSVDAQGRASASSYTATTITPSGGLISTVLDFAKFDRGLRQGSLLLRPHTLAAAWRAPVGRNGSLPHGYGWFVQTYNNEPVVWQFGVGANASSSSLVVTLPARGITLILLANSDGLSKPASLSAGNITVSPFARVLLPTRDQVGRRGLMRIGVIGIVTITLSMATARPASAEWQIKPFFGVTYGGSTTFSDPDHAVGHANPSVGVTGMLLGDVFGIEADFGHQPGFFEHRDQQSASAPVLVTNSSTSTLTGNIVVALPRRLAEYTLRPYFVGGAGAMFVNVDDGLGNPFISRSLKAMDLGGGVTGFLTNRIGLSWDVRYFRSIDRTFESGLSLASEQLSFWRANMAVAIRLKGGL